MTSSLLPLVGPHALLLKRIERCVVLSAAERDTLPGADAPTQGHPPGTPLGRADRTTTPLLIAGGWACHTRILPDGRRQIVSLVLPGDCTNIMTSPAAALATRCTTIALTHVVTVSMERATTAVCTRPEEHPALARAFATFAEHEHARLLERIVTLGRRTAIERVAYFLLETRDRLLDVGLARAHSFPCPLTQEVMGDTLGLSAVHVNRTLQQMRRQNLLTMQSGEVELRDPDALAEIADYQPFAVRLRSPVMG